MVLILSLLLSLTVQGADVSFQGKKAAELYQSINNTGLGNCGSGCVDVSELMCTWSNSSDSKRIGCSFKDANGKRQEVESAKARRLVKAMNAVKQIDTSCGAGTCGFRDAQNVKCSEEKTKAKKLKSHCSVSTHVESCLSADQQKELQYLKTLFKNKQEENPGCETIRGAGGCLAPREMVAMQKLEGLEKNGCKAPRSSNHGRDVKPTMEAN